jgi:hypothetical protein
MHSKYLPYGRNRVKIGERDFQIALLILKEKNWVVTPIPALITLSSETASGGFVIPTHR